MGCGVLLWLGTWRRGGVLWFLGGLGGRRGRRSLLGGRRVLVVGVRWAVVGRM